MTPSKPRSMHDIKADLREAKTLLAKHRHSVADGMGCDFSSHIDRDLVWTVMSYEEELADARAWKEARRKAT